MNEHIMIYFNSDRGGKIATKYVDQPVEKQRSNQRYTFK